MLPNRSAILFLCAALVVAADEVSVPAAATAPAPAVAAPAEAKPAELTIADVPEVVRAAISTQTANATIDHIRTGEASGEKIYVVTFTRDGVQTVLSLNSQGETVRMKAERPAAAQPDAPSPLAPATPKAP